MAWNPDLRRLHWGKFLMLWFLVTPALMILLGGVAGGLGALIIYLGYGSLSGEVVPGLASVLVLLLASAVATLPVFVMLSFTWFWLGGKESPQQQG